MTQFTKWINEIYKSNMTMWYWNILSRYSINIYYDKANYQKAFDNSKESVNYRKFIKHCQVEHDITHDILSWKYDVIYAISWQSFRVNSNLIFNSFSDFSLWFNLYMSIHHDNQRKCYKFYNLHQDKELLCKLCSQHAN